MGVGAERAPAGCPQFPPSSLLMEATLLSLSVALRAPTLQSRYGRGIPTPRLSTLKRLSVVDAGAKQ